MKNLLAFAVLFLAGCSHSHREAAVQTSCPSINLLPDTSHCEQDGEGVTCEIGDVPPSSWGNCIEGIDKQFTCLKDGLISHYDKNSDLAWKQPAGKCPELTKQIESNGQGPIRMLPPIPMPPVEVRSKKSKA